MHINISIQNDNPINTHIYIISCIVWYFHNLGWPFKPEKKLLPPPFYKFINKGGRGYNRHFEKNHLNIV